MTKPPFETLSNSLHETVLTGGGEAAALMRDRFLSAQPSPNDAQRPLGSVDTWPQSLQTAVGMCLSSVLPLSILWGRDCVLIYNDGYRPIVGAKHPQALGRPIQDNWPEIWPNLRVIFEGIYQTGQPTVFVDVFHLIERNGRLEEAYYTSSYSPIWDEMGQVAGIFHTMVETTAQVVSERRLQTLGNLATQLTTAKTAQECCQRTIASLSQNTRDLPYVLLYLSLEDGPHLQLSGIAGSPNFRVLESAQLDELETLASSSTRVLLLTQRDRLIGAMVLGVNPHRLLDQDYQQFFELVAGQVTAALVVTQAGEDGRKQPLAEPGVRTGDEGIDSSTHDRFVPSQLQYAATPLSRILLVDDSAELHSHLRQVLCERWLVETATNSSIALDMIRQQPPDLVLTEGMAGKIDGLRLLRTLRADPKTQNIPIMLLLAGAGEEETIAQLDAEADDYLIKPFSDRKLIARVETQLLLSHLRQEESINRLKDEFLMMITHELQAPLAAILGWARLLQNRPFDAARLAQALTTIERNAMVEAKLVRDLLDISNILTGKLLLKSQLVNLNSLIKTVVATFRETAKAKGIELADVTSNVELGDVLADGDRLRQVIVNLLDNAIKFTPEGGRIDVNLSSVSGHSISSKGESKQQPPEQESTTQYIQLMITDTGIGISPDVLPYLFDRFSQLATPSPHPLKKVGIGLAIARHLVELHNGMIYAESDGVGQGATFIVRLPLFSHHSRENAAQE